MSKQVTRLQSNDVPKRLLVTGGAGFIGSHFVHQAIERGSTVWILDALTYAGHEINLKDSLSSGRARLIQGSIADSERVRHLLADFQPDAVINFAAESHVDRSIEGPEAFVQTNIVGTFRLLSESLRYFNSLSERSKVLFRYVQISTDEVFGSLGKAGYFTETSQIQPNSPYSSSKAAADMLVRAWFHTYGLPTITTHCSNNYGPRQFPEKLIPTMIRAAIRGGELPVYGDGSNIRDWIHVSDHCRGIRLALDQGRPGEIYCFGGRSERSNNQVVEKICEYLDELAPSKLGASYGRQIRFVTDRLGHDWRYAIDDTKAETELGFKRRFTQFEDGLRETVEWYLENEAWCQTVLKSKEELI